MDKKTFDQIIKIILIFSIILLFSLKITFFLISLPNLEIINFVFITLLQATIFFILIVRIFIYKGIARQLFP
ncbi:MAG: hypothetical protein ACTSSK_06340, partial [Candidatus Heimdallarchaeota archaeon]